MLDTGTSRPSEVPRCRRGSLLGIPYQVATVRVAINQACSGTTSLCVWLIYICVYTGQEPAIPVTVDTDAFISHPSSVGDISTTLFSGSNVGLP